MKQTSSDNIHVLETNQCSSLSNKSLLGYQIGCSPKKNIFIRLISNSSSGQFSKTWIAWDEIQKEIKRWPKDKPFTSFLLFPCFGSSSANCSGFIFACLVDLNIFKRISNKRSYELLDTKPFLDEMKQLIASESISPTAKKKRALAKKVSKKTVTKKRPATSKKKTTKK